MERRGGECGSLIFEGKPLGGKGKIPAGVRNRFYFETFPQICFTLRFHEVSHGAVDKAASRPLRGYPIKNGESLIWQDNVDSLHGMS
jgi:hypothetical protein